MEKIAREVAAAEVEKWLDKKNVSQNKRESFKDHIDVLVDAVSEGALSINDECIFTQKLNCPVGDTTHLNYRLRLNRLLVTPYMKGVKASDGDGRIVAYTAALTDIPKNIISALDTEDQRISDSIAVFFVG
jgi:hypothetical protein